MSAAAPAALARLLLPPGVDPAVLPLLVGRGLRAFADGYVAVLLPAYLLALGFGQFDVGLLSTATLAGSAVATLAVGAVGHRWPPRSLLLGAALLMTATGLGFAGVSAFWPLLVVAFFGTINPGSGDVSVFLPLEHARLAHAAEGNARTALFARYSLTGSLCAAVGALAAGLPPWLATVADVPLLTGLRAMFVLYAVIGARDLAAVPPPARAPKDASAHAAAPLGPSRGIVFKLAALFSVDAFAGGLVVNSLLTLWLFERFGLSLGEAGLFFFWSGLLAAFSQLAAPVVARRIGLLNTMVFTHIPANVFLILAALAPSLPARAGLAVRAERAVADGRAHAHRVRHGGRHARRARRGGELHRRAAQPRLGRQPDARRRAAGRGPAERAAGGLRRIEDRLRPRAARVLPAPAPAGGLRIVQCLLELRPSRLPLRQRTRCKSRDQSAPHASPAARPSRTSFASERAAIDVDVAPTTLAPRGALPRIARSIRMASCSSPNGTARSPHVQRCIGRLLSGTLSSAIGTQPTSHDLPSADEQTAPPMIKFYFNLAPNPTKVALFLEESGAALR